VRDLLRALLVIAASAFCLLADTVTTSSGTYDPFPNLTALNNPITGQNGSMAFWANHSVDGLTNPANLSSPWRPDSQLNIGNFLTGTCGPSAATVGSCPTGTFDGAATPNFTPSTLGYYADGDAPISSFYFTRGGTAQMLSPDLIYTANLVDFGWYVAGDPTDSTSIYTGLTESVGMPGGYTLANIPLGTNYGFYASVNYGSGYIATYYTQSQYNSFTQPNGATPFETLLGSDMINGANKQHFAFFDPAATDVIALEDGIGDSGYEGIGDYQDAVFSIGTPVISSTPESATWWMAGVTLAAGAFSLRRRFSLVQSPHLRRPDSATFRQSNTST
jgi:hypothetical protein